MSTSNSPPRQAREAQIATIDEIELTEFAHQQIRANAQQAQRLRANAALPDNSWGEVDDAVYRTQDDVLTVVDDLRGRGLVTGVSVYSKTAEWNTVDSKGEATISMDLETEDPESSVAYDLEGVPVPVIQDSFSVGWREQQSPNAAQNVADTPDTLDATVTARHVAEAMEDLVFNGWGPSISAGSNSYQLYGLTNHPDISTGSLGSWGTDSTVIRDDIRAMANAIKDNQYWPGDTGYLLYISRDYYDELDDVDPDGSGDQTVRDRVEELSYISEIQPSDWLPSGSALMFRPTQDVVDLAVGSEIGGQGTDMTQTIEYDGTAGLRSHLLVFSVMAPRVKSTASAQSGIAFFN